MTRLRKILLPLRPLLLLVIAVAALAAQGRAAAWPQYRGPNRDGRSSETGLLTTWPESGPQILWRATLGSGYSGLAVAEGRVITLFGSGNDELAAAFDTTTGREIWRFRMGSNFRSGQGDGPRSTPTIDGELVYVLGARSNLFALDAASGRVRWTRDLAEELGARVPEWGTSTSPLVEGSHLIVDVAGTGGHGIVAFDKVTGTVAWHSGSHRPAYSSPIAVTLAGERQIVAFTAEGVQGLSVEGGEQRWSTQWTTDWDVNAATPVFVPRSGIFISSGYDQGAMLLEIVRERDEFEAREVWRSRAMKNHFNSSVLVGSYLYGFDMGTLKCLEARTGEEKWRARGGFSKGSLLYAEGHLYVLGGGGELGLVEATPAGFRKKSGFRVLDSKTWTMPSLSEGVLYVRDFSQLVALEMRTPVAQ